MKRFLLIFLAFFLVLGIFLSSPKTTFATTDPFPSLGFPCLGKPDLLGIPRFNNPEFSSLRPYQAAPCGTANKALFCSNNLIFTETFDMANHGECRQKLHSSGDITFTCNTYGDIDYRLGGGYIDKHTLYVSLKDSSLPILGNTESTKNSRSITDGLDDATKMNEYASWYLNGVNLRAESGATEEAKILDNRLVNYSGPIQKLLPGVIADDKRIKIIENVSTQVPTDDPKKTENENHNQIVVCAKNNFPQIIPKWLSDILGLPNFGVQKPVDCYPTAKAESKADNIYRLEDWTGESNITNAINSIKGSLTRIFPGNIIVQNITASMGDHWSKREPPLPWNFTDPQLYTKSYNEWRGQLCLLIPNLVGGQSLICIGAWPILSNPYADLFSYVPFAETTDKKGAEIVTGFSANASKGAKVAELTNNGITSPPLYFAHTEEVKQLSTTLNQTYIPKDLTGTPVPVPKTTEVNNCSAVNIRTNPGDNLFPESEPLQIKDVSYKITEATCHEVYVEKTCYIYPPGYPNSGAPIPYDCSTHTFECLTDITLTIATDTLTPNANEIFSTTTADSTSTFRRIYPKVEDNAPVSCVADMAANTSVTYDATKSKPPDGVKQQTFNVGNFPSDGGSAQVLTFPHLGSVYEYFLKGIQTALRPQGYGSGTPISGNDCTGQSFCDGKLFAKLSPPGSTTDKAKSYFQTYIKPNLTPQLISAYAQAEQKTGVPCEVLAGVHFEEGDNNPNQSLQNGGALHGTILASAIQAGNEIKAKVGGKIDSWDKLITALSRYNGGGNSNCYWKTDYNGPCPPPEGIDDLYPTAWIDLNHLKMYLIYCTDGKRCSPFPLVSRPGSLTVATELYNSESK